MPPVPFASRLLFAAAWCVGRLPLSLQQWLGDALGRFAHWRDTREARVARRNLELVAAAPQFPTWLARLIGTLVHG